MNLELSLPENGIMFTGSPIIDSQHCSQFVDKGLKDSRLCHGKNSEVCKKSSSRADSIGELCLTMKEKKTSDVFPSQLRTKCVVGWS